MLFYLILRIQGERKYLAMVSLYGRPHADLHEQSSGALYACSLGGDDGVAVIEVKTILSVVAVVPFPAHLGWQDRVFVVEKPGLDVAAIGGVAEAIDEEEPAEE